MSRPKGSKNKVKKAGRPKSKGKVGRPATKKKAGRPKASKAVKAAKVLTRKRHVSTDHEAAVTAIQKQAIDLAKKLGQRRNELMEEIAQIDVAMQEFKVGFSVGAKHGKKPSTGKRGRKLGSGGGGRIVEMAKEAMQPGVSYTISEIFELIVKNGYETDAQNPKVAITGVLGKHEDFERVDRGIYRKKPSASVNVSAPVAVPTAPAPGDVTEPETDDEHQNFDPAQVEDDDEETEDEN